MVNHPVQNKFITIL